MDKNKTPAVFGSTELPAHLKKSAGLGNENISAETLATPTLKQVQSVNMNKFAPGTQAGDWVVQPSEQNFGQEVYIVPIKFIEEWIIWPAELGNNPPLATHYSEADATADLEFQNQQKNAAFDGARIVYTHTHMFLTMDPETGELSDIPVKCSMAASKLQLSKSLNTQIVSRPGDRFSAVWKITSSLKNTAKHAYHVAEVEFQAYLNEPEYNAAKQVYTNNTPPAIAA